MSLIYTAVGAGIALAGLDKLMGQRGYARMFHRLDWSEDQVRAAAAAEVAGGLLMVPRGSRRIGGAIVLGVSAVVLASEVRHGAGQLGLARGVVLLAGLAALASSGQR